MARIVPGHARAADLLSEAMGADELAAALDAMERLSKALDAIDSPADR